MRFSKHIKLAAFVGLIVGMFHGTIDVIIRLIVWSFEWFEFYQTLLASLIAFTLGFVVLGLFIELMRKILKLKITKKALIIFYCITSAIVLLLFYVETIVNRDLLSKLAFLSPGSLVINLPIILVFGLVYILLLTKGKEIIYNTVSFFNKKKINKIIQNYIFIIVVFIITSLILDLYLIKYVPSSASDSKLEGYSNIILISMDAQRPDHLSFYGYPLETSPNLDKLSKEAVVFENVISPSTWTILSHGGMFTGKYVSNFDPGHINEGIRSEETTLAEILRSKGYNTAGFVSVSWLKKKFGFGQGFATYKDRIDFFDYHAAYDKYSIMGTIFTFFPIYKSIFNLDLKRSGKETNDLVFRWLDKNKDGPFFMFIHYMDAHMPYNPSEEFRKKFTNDTRDFEELEEEFIRYSNIKEYENVSKDIMGFMIKLYDAGVAELDYTIGNLLKKLDEIGVKNNTIIIFTADHGERLGDRKYTTNRKALYQETIHVPLLIYYPKEFKTKRIQNRVETIDIPPTILDILEIEGPEDLDGISFLPLIRNKEQYVGKEYVKSELFGMIDDLENYEIEYQVAVISGDWKLIETKLPTGAIKSELYNLRTDPKEQRNLYGIYKGKGKSLRKYIVNITDK